MKITLTFKTPDAVDYALEHLSKKQRDKAETVIAKYVEYGECVSIEVDINTGKAKVLPV